MILTRYFGSVAKATATGWQCDSRAREYETPAPTRGGDMDAVMGKHDELELNIELAKDYIAQFEALQAKYLKAKTWGEFSQDDIRKSAELILRAEEFLNYALRRGKIPKELSKRLDQLIKWNDSLAK